MEFPKITVIIPIYNANEYLEECLESVRKQSYSNLEVLMINDGSTNDTQSRLLEWEKRDSRFLAVCKENGGVGSARNLGLQMASGDYVIFLDSDDWLADDCVEVLYKRMLKDSTDVVVSDFTEVYEGNTEKRNYIHIDEDRVIGRTEVFSDMVDAKIYTYVVIGKLFKKEAIGDVRFEKIAFSEDMLFARQVFAKCSKISVCDYVGYYYRINGGGVTSDNSRIAEKRAGDLVAIWNTWKLAKEQNVAIKYETLEYYIFAEIKGIFGRFIKGKGYSGSYMKNIYREIYHSFHQFKNTKHKKLYFKYIDLFLLVFASRDKRK